MGNELGQNPSSYGNKRTSTTNKPIPATTNKNEPTTRKYTKRPRQGSNLRPAV